MTSQRGGIAPTTTAGNAAARVEFRRWAKGAVRRMLTLHLPMHGPARLVYRALYAAHVACREGIQFLLRLGWYEPLFRSQCERIGERFTMEQLPYMEGSGRIVIGDGVRLSGRPAIIFGNRAGFAPALTIGDNTFIGHGCYLYVAISVRVGRNCLLAGGTRVYDYDGHPLDAAERRAGMPTPACQVQPVVLGDDVWVGSDAVILKGVSVGDRAVIAARSVVTKDVPPDAIVAGNPARIVRRLKAPADEGDSSASLDRAEPAHCSVL